ncbi:HEPN domain-containing protein [Rhodopila sp.]|uniref:HEPN domain-containing protein n=1 Tax=Rhodopila sp. TaxID=2480087 RepID=UPI003D11AD38
MIADPDRAAVSWQKAEAHLGEAIAQDVDTSPMAVIHSSYYAMFHAARAVLFEATGSAAKRHDAVIQTIRSPGADPRR